MNKEIVLIASDCWFLILGAKVLDFKFCEIKAVNIVVLDQEQEATVIHTCVYWRSEAKQIMYSSKLTQPVVPLFTYVGTFTY